jgi:hypothetical protein
MSQSKEPFTADEVRDLVTYGQKIVFEAIRASLKATDEEFEEILLRFLRKYARLKIFPELILEEIPREAVRSGGALSIECRESIFDLLGNRSVEVVSMSDQELCRLVSEKLRNYH